MEINLGNTVPLFAHDVAMSTITKEKKGKDGKLKKESFTELVFIDAVRKSAIARIILPEGVLEDLPKMIEENLKKIKKDLKSKVSLKHPKEEKKEAKKEAKAGYFG